MKILLVMSSPEELSPFLGTVSHRRVSFENCPAWNFSDRSFLGLAILVGMGGTALQALTRDAMVSYLPDVVVAAGYGGALTPLPPPSGILIASECWRLKSMGSSLLPVEYSPPAAAAALASLLQAQGLPVVTGASVTTPMVMPKASLPDPVFRLPNPVLDLETAGVVAAARSQHLPCLAVRAISDGGGEEIPAFLADMINRYQGVPISRLMLALMADPRRLKHCLHLWRRARLAGRNLAGALKLIFDHLAQQ